MEAKGTAVKSISEFVRAKFPTRYDEWLNSLPVESQTIFKNPIFQNDWYSLETAILTPTDKLCQLFFHNTPEGARQCGRHSAETALTGIYKFFLLVATPSFIMGKASGIFTTYYRPVEMKLVESSSNHCLLHILKFPESHPLIEYRIAGWCERALEIANCKGVTVGITQTLTKGHPLTEFFVRWN